MVIEDREERDEQFISLPQYTSSTNFRLKPGDEIFGQHHCRISARTVIGRRRCTWKGIENLSKIYNEVRESHWIEKRSRSGGHDRCETVKEVWTSAKVPETVCGYAIELEDS